MKTEQQQTKVMRPLASQDTRNTREETMVEDQQKPIPFKEQISDLIQAFHKEMGVNEKQKLAASLALVQTLQKKIIENPAEEKYRTVKTANPKINEALTKYYNGLAILKLIGFKESYDQESKQTVLILPGNLSKSYMKSQKLDLDAQIN